MSCRRRTSPCPTLWWNYMLNSRRQQMRFNKEINPSTLFVVSFLPWRTVWVKLQEAEENMKKWDEELNSLKRFLQTQQKQTEEFRARLQESKISGRPERSAPKQSSKAERRASGRKSLKHWRGRSKSCLTCAAGGRQKKRAVMSDGAGRDAPVKRKSMGARGCKSSCHHHSSTCFCLL